MKKIILILLILIFPKLSFTYEEVDIKNYYNKIYKNTLKISWNNDYEAIETIENILEIKKENSSKNRKEIINKLQKENNEKFFNLILEKEELENKKILEKNLDFNNFKNKVLNKTWIIKENWVRYWYIFDNYRNFSWNWKITKRDLESNWINPNKELLSIRDGKPIFIKDFKKYRLISDQIIYGIPWKLEFLETLLNIKIFDRKEENLDSEFIKLKRISTNLWNISKNKEEIIKNIYNYILANLSYQTNIKSDDFEIFSWIKTFKNKVWVCQWYVELFNLMLGFNNIKSEILKWDVLTSEDFPKIWHAWVKIDNFYYDPTFDDPVWAKETKKFKEYDFYKLPKDLFYTNRFDKGEAPEFLKKQNLENRKIYVNQRLFSIYDKYKNNNYNLLKETKFKKYLWLWAKDEIKVKNLVNKFWFTEIKNWKVFDSWKEKYLKSLKYYELEDEKLLSVLRKIDFDMTWYKIFLLNENWNQKYVLSNKYKY